MDRKGIPALAGAVLAALLPAFLLAADTAVSTTAWTNGQWFDGTRFRRVDVYSVGPWLTLKRPKAVDKTVDLAGQFVTGAFGEAHNHNIPGIDTGANIRTYLAQGIYYVMIQGNTPSSREELDKLVNSPASVGVAFANGLFTAPGGHPTALVQRNIKIGGMAPADLDGGFLLPVASTDDVDRRWWTQVRRQRPDFVKVVLVYSEDRVAGIPRPADSDRHGLDPALVAPIVKRAHHEKLRVSAHVESAYDFEVAVKAGADIIAHLPGFWPDPARIAKSGIGIYKISDEAARLAGRRHVTVVTTIGESLRAILDAGGDDARDHPEMAALREPLLDVYRHNLGVLARRGVRIAIGSDQFRGTSLGEALTIHEAGLMSAPALLRAFSTDTAATIFPNLPFGLVRGAPADFLVFAEDPLADFTAVQRPRRRVKAGVELPG